jgi:hypothetical protein
MHKSWSCRRMIIVIASVLFSVRLLIELAFPFIPFKTDNCFLRIIAEMPFYYALAWAYESLSGDKANNYLWPMTISVAFVETVVICSVVWIVWKISARFIALRGNK